MKAFTGIMALTLPMAALSIEENVKVRMFDADQYPGVVEIIINPVPQQVGWLAIGVSDSAGMANTHAFIPTVFESGDRTETEYTTDGRAVVGYDTSNDAEPGMLDVTFENDKLALSLRSIAGQKLLNDDNTDWNPDIQYLVYAYSTESGLIQNGRLTFHNGDYGSFELPNFEEYESNSDGTPSASPTTAPSTSASPTTAPSTSASPTTAPSASAGPSTDSPSVAPTPEATIQITDAPTTAPPTVDNSTSAPTVDNSTSAPTVDNSTSAPTVDNSTSAPTAGNFTAVPTVSTDAPTGSDSSSPTAAPTTAQSRTEAPTPNAATAASVSLSAVAVATMMAVRSL